MKGILLLATFAVILFPWQLVCASHPVGHNHHHAEGELSPCEERRACQDLSLWPPMDCLRLSIVAENTELPSKTKLKVTLSLVPDVLTSFTDMALPESPFVKLPDPLANSDPPRYDDLQRGPPCMLF